MQITTHCPDGTDPNCYGTVTVELPYSGLTPDTVRSNWTGEYGDSKLVSAEIWPPAGDDWLKANENWLSESEIDDIKTSGHFIIEYDDLPSHHCCSACGSSETYDDEGNNITAL